ncbi:MAG: serine hydrolase [Spirochaetales bacterium]|nr:serine hydrolase [Spirochaetales bacterium]
MKKAGKALGISLLFILLVQGYCSAAGAAEETDALFAPFNMRDSPGAAVLVMKDGKVVFERGYGLADLDHGIPITPATVFNAGSVSKQFAAFAVLLLEEEGKLSLDDAIGVYLPGMPDFGGEITIRHLLLHTSGLRDILDLLQLSGRSLSERVTREEFLHLIRMQKELNFHPGSQYAYCNTGYLLLSEIVAKASGRSFADFTRRRIFEPLGMTNTRFIDDADEVVRNRADAYYKPVGEGGYVKLMWNLDTEGAGSLYTTAEDLARWIDNFETPRVGGESILKRMQTPGTLVDGAPISYAFGLVVGTYRDLDVVFHEGQMAGYRSAVYRFPRERLAVVVLDNLASIDPDRYAKRVADIYLGIAPRGAAAETQAETHTAIGADPAVFEEYAGVYRFPSGSFIDLTVENNRLMARIDEGKIELVPETADGFFAAAARIEIAFVRDTGGKVVMLYYTREGTTRTARKLNEKRLTAEQGEEYAGDYHSDELGVTYSLSVEAGRLAAPNTPLSGIPWERDGRDQFIAGRYALEFVRGDDGQITSFLISCERSKNIKFVKTGT